MRLASVSQTSSIDEKLFDVSRLNLRQLGQNPGIETESDSCHSE